MLSYEATTPWLSVFLHFDVEAENVLPHGDRVLLEVVHPLVDALRERVSVRHYFFIRYKKKGPHVRLRLQGSLPSLRTEGVSEIRQRLGIDPDGRRLPTTRGTDAIEGDESEIVEEASHPLVSHVRWVPYEREIERYGGRDAVPLAESHFEDSSTFALEALSTNRPMSNTSRMGHGLMALHLIFDVLAPNQTDVRRLVKRHYRLYMPPSENDGWAEALRQRFEHRRESLETQVRRISAAVRNDDYPAPYFATFAEGLRKTRKRAEALSFSDNFNDDSPELPEERILPADVVASYAHMTCNRLGVSRPNESFMSYALSRVLSNDT